MKTNFAVIKSVNNSIKQCGFGINCCVIKGVSTMSILRGATPPSFSGERKPHEKSKPFQMKTAVIVILTLIKYKTPNNLGIVTIFVSMSTISS